MRKHWGEQESYRPRRWNHSHPPAWSLVSRGLCDAVTNDWVYFVVLDDLRGDVDDILRHDCHATSLPTGPLANAKAVQRKRSVYR